MKNQEVFIKKVSEGAEIRFEINENHSPVLASIRKIFKGVFNKDPKMFTETKDAMYYKGGWPSENTPPRLQSLADKVADIFMLLSYTGNMEEFEKYLTKRGIEIKPILSEQAYFNAELLDDSNWLANKRRSNKVKKEWAKLFGDTPMPKNNKELLNTLLDRACEEQAIICQMADEIKISKAQEVESKCDIKKGNFVKVVNLNYKGKLRQKDISEDLDKIKKNISEQTEMIKTL